MRTLFTLAHYHHVPQLTLLVRSLHRYMPEETIQIWIVDAPQSVPLPEWPKATWHFISELPDDRWQDMALRYSYETLRENLKPFVGHFLLETWERILYIDPKIQFFQPFSDVWQAADSAQMVLIPELLNAEGHPKQEQILNQGIYQNHFWVARKTTDSHDFFTWWKDQVEVKGFVDLCRGMNADRYFLEIAPSVFPHFMVYRHPGIGVSERNKSERKVNWFQRMCNDFPLVSYEFQDESEYPASVQPAMSSKERAMWNSIRPQYGLPEYTRRQQKIRASLLRWEARIHRFFDQF